jgi:hypothetical protein
MLEFKEIQQDMLFEMLRLCGLADSMDDPRCALCDEKLDASPVPSAGPPAEAPAAAGGADRRIFRCQDCGEFLQCRACCLTRHSMTPLHVLKVRRHLDI